MEIEIAAALLTWPLAGVTTTPCVQAMANGIAVALPEESEACCAEGALPTWLANVSVPGENESESEPPIVHSPVVQTCPVGQSESRLQSPPRWPLPAHAAKKEALRIAIQPVELRSMNCTQRRIRTLRICIKTNAQEDGPLSQRAF